MPPPPQLSIFRRPCLSSLLIELIRSKRNITGHDVSGSFSYMQDGTAHFEKDIGCDCLRNTRVTNSQPVL